SSILASGGRKSPEGYRLRGLTPPARQFGPLAQTTAHGRPPQGSSWARKGPTPSFPSGGLAQPPAPHRTRGGRPDLDHRVAGLRAEAVRQRFGRVRALGQIFAVEQVHVLLAAQQS